MSQRWSLFVVTVAVAFSGCGDATPPPTSPVSETKPAATFTAAEQAQIDLQKVCPVGGEALGSMGSPYKMMVGERAVYLCCEHCKGSVSKDPEKYLAILDAAAKAPAEATTPPETPAKP